MKTMNTHVAFLRGINVGGNTMVSMKDLAAICTQIGFENVRTYLNSGNVIFKSPLPEAELQKALEKALSGKNRKGDRGRYPQSRRSGTLGEEQSLPGRCPVTGRRTPGHGTGSREYRGENLPSREGRRLCPANGMCISTTRTAWAAQN